jgi:DNA-binding XRE family transcriptional regulator
MRLRTELKRKLRKQLGTRLEQLRDTLELSRNKMAARLDVHRVTLQRNEDGRALPEISTLLKLSNAMDVSMDWLFFDKGPMFYKQKTDEEQNKPVHNCMDALPPDYRELLEYMDKFPVLRYEILLQFRKFLKDNKESPVQNATID